MSATVYLLPDLLLHRQTDRQTDRLYLHGMPSSQQCAEKGGEGVEGCDWPLAPSFFVFVAAIVAFFTVLQSGATPPPSSVCLRSYFKPKTPVHAQVLRQDCSHSEMCSLLSHQKSTIRQPHRVQP